MRKVITNGDKSIEAYTVLDDGVERTILLHTAAQQLNMKGQPEDLLQRTVRQDQEILHRAAVSFTVSLVTNRLKKFNIQCAFTAGRLGLAEQTHTVDDWTAIAAKRQSSACTANWLRVSTPCYPS